MSPPPETPIPALSRLEALEPGSALDTIGAALRDIAAQLHDADTLGKALAREECIRKLTDIGVKSAVKVVDAALRSADSPPTCDNAQGSAMSFRDPDPWPEEVAGAALLAELSHVIRRFVVLQQASIDAICLWIVFAHAHAVAQISPILCLTSPTVTAEMKPA